MRRLVILISGLFLLILTGCRDEQTTRISDNYRTYYEVFVRSFYDSDDDGIGDLKGLVHKLDYLNNGGSSRSKSLNVGGIWLMPVMPSPSYHKYDVTDYYAIAPEYGTMQDFEELLEECRTRDVKVIIDLVVNHTSSEHPWFRSAARSIGIPPCGEDTCVHEELCREHNPYCAYYNFAWEPQSGYAQTPLYEDIYYECRFVKEMPDLNLDEPAVRWEITDIMRFWLEKGVGGFRLDAVTYFYYGNTQKNADFLHWLTAQAKGIDKDCYIVGEAWSTAGVIRELYTGADSFFNFPFSQISGLYIPVVRTGDARQAAARMQEWNDSIREVNPRAIDAVFLSNHDNARSYGMLNRNEDLAKMAASFYILSPGNAFIYYGEELGMIGSGRDENKRLPMYWSAEDKTGIPLPPPSAEFFEPPAFSAMQQMNDDTSLFSHYRRLIEIKNKYPEIARGTIEAIPSENDAVAAYALTYDGSTILVVHNFGETEATQELSNLEGKYKLLEHIGVSSEKARLKGGTVSLPARSSVIIGIK